MTSCSRLKKHPYLAHYTQISANVHLTNVSIAECSCKLEQKKPTKMSLKQTIRLVFNSHEDTHQQQSKSKEFQIISPTVNLTQVDARSSNLSVLILFIPEKQRIEDGALPAPRCGV